MGRGGIFGGHGHMDDLIFGTFAQLQAWQASCSQSKLASSHFDELLLFSSDCSSDMKL